MSEEVHAAIVDSISELEGAGDNGEASPPPSLAAPDTTPAQPSSDPPAERTAPPQPDVTKPIIPETVAPEVTERLPGRLPLARHEKIVQNLRAEHDAAIQKMKAEHEEAIKQQLTPYQQQRELLDIADRDPERFLQALASADPRYRERLAPVLAAIEQASSGNGHDAPIGEMPAPDVQLADGTTGYSPEGLDRLLKWNAQQVESRLAKQFEPLLQEYQSRQATTAALHRVNAQLERAMKLPGFNEQQKQIAAAMRADKSLSLLEAYVQVVVPGMQPNKDKMRQELLAEINGGANGKAKLATGTAPSGGAGRPASEAGDLSSVIRAAIAHLPR
jgi:hypothetical protein